MNIGRLDSAASSTHDEVAAAPRKKAGPDAAASFSNLMQSGAPAGDKPPSAGKPSANSSSGDGAKGGDSATQNTNSDLQSAMSSLQGSDPTLFAKTLKDGQSGDGNALVTDELKAYKNGDITKQQATEEVSGAQSLANANGGGKINGQVIKDETSALGTNVIHGGQTRAGAGFEKFAESFTGIGAAVKGIQDKTGPDSKPDSILTAAQPALQQGTQQALQDMQQADPNLAQKFQQDGKSRDGNSMVEGLVALKKESANGTGPGTFSDADAQLLGSQIGSVGKGKVSSTEDKAFTNAFGTDTLSLGSSAASKGWNKFENSVGNMMQQVVSPLTDSVGGIDQLAKGNIKGAMSDFGQAAIGAASDAAMVVAPEAAPEIEVGAQAASAAAKVGLSGAEKVGSSGAEGSFSLFNALSKGNDISNDLSNVSNLMPGSSSNSTSTPS